MLLQHDACLLLMPCVLRLALPVTDTGDVASIDQHGMMKISDRRVCYCLQRAAACMSACMAPDAASFAMGACTAHPCPASRTYAPTRAPLQEQGCDQVWRRVDLQHHAGERRHGPPKGAAASTRACGAAHSSTCMCAAAHAHAAVSTRTAYCSPLLHLLLTGRVFFLLLL